MPVEYTEDYTYNAKNQLVKRSRRNPESPYDKYKHNDKTNNLSTNNMSLIGSESSMNRRLNNDLLLETTYIYDLQGNILKEQQIHSTKIHEYDPLNRCITTLLDNGDISSK